MQTLKRKARPVGERVHDWLSEPEGQIFEFGKWRFWFAAVVGLQFLNAFLTWSIYESAGGLQNYMGVIMAIVATIVGWLALGALHYSGVANRKISRGVSLLDSLTLLFVVIHFAFLMWAYGDLKTIQKAEAKYDADATAYNAKADKISGDNVAIAKAVLDAERERVKAEKLKNDTAYQTRKAAEAGAYMSKKKSGDGNGISPSLSTSQVELEKPVKPEQTAMRFLTKWDVLIRVANFGELLLCALTLIFIRNQSAANNSPRRNVPPSPAPELSEPDFPEELDAASVEQHGRENFTRKKEPNQKEPKNLKKHASSVSAVAVFDPEGLKRLRQTLKDISFRLPGFSFKSYVKGDAVWIFKMRANKGTQQTVSSAKATLEILSDAMRMKPGDFQARVEKFLKQNGFTI